MEYIYSEEVDPILYETHGLGTEVRLRLHKDLVKESRGALRAQEDWSKHVQAIGLYHGGLGERFSFIRVTVPECLPERLEIISYANEYAFLYDGGWLPTFSRSELIQGCSRCDGESRSTRYECPITRYTEYFQPRHSRQRDQPGNAPREAHSSSNTLRNDGN